MKTSYRAKVRYLCSEKLSASGGFAPKLSDQELYPLTSLETQTPTSSGFLRQTSSPGVLPLDSSGAHPQKFPKASHFSPPNWKRVE